MPLFTVFTPTYNRAYTLTRLFDSLAAQTMLDFEWVVVDDGSTDGTEALVSEFAARAPFPIHYRRQRRGGTHVAMNAGVALASGELFLPFDSDDWCVPHALERFAHHWNTIPADRRDGFAAVTALCQTKDGDLIGTPFPADVIDSNSLEMRYRYHVRGDKWGFTRTDVMREFPIPTGDFNIIPSGIVWNAIAHRYRTRYVNERLKYVEYLPDGQTRNGAAYQPAGWALFYRHVLRDALPYLRHSPALVTLEAVNYARYSFLAGTTWRQQLAGLDTLGQRALWAMALPYGFEKARRQRRRGEFAQ